MSSMKTGMMFTRDEMLRATGESGSSSGSDVEDGDSEVGTEALGSWSMNPTSVVTLSL